MERIRDVNAFAIGCWLPKPWHEQQLLACVLSIRSVGHVETILILTVDPELEERLEGRIEGLGCQVWTFPEIPTDPNFGTMMRADMQKLYFWAVSEFYDKVVGMDTDIIFHHNAEELFKLPAVTGFEPRHRAIMKSQPPVSFGHFVYKPDWKIVRDLKEIIQEGFSVTGGWGHHGLLEWEGKEYHWDFFGAEAAAGYLYYYFYLRNKSNSVPRDVFCKCFKHYCGKMSRENKENYLIDMSKLIRF